MWVSRVTWHCWATVWQPTSQCWTERGWGSWPLGSCLIPHCGFVDCSGSPLNIQLLIVFVTWQLQLEAPDIATICSTFYVKCSAMYCTRISLLSISFIHTCLLWHLDMRMVQLTSMKMTEKAWSMYVDWSSMLAMMIMPLRAMPSSAQSSQSSTKAHQADLVWDSICATK